MNGIQFLLNQSNKFFRGFFFLFFALTVGCGRRFHAPIKSNSVHEHERIYFNSIQSGDYVSGIQALNYLVVTSSDSMAYTDSLSNMYFKLALFKQSIFWCHRALKFNDTNGFVLNILANSYLRSSDHLNAIEIFEKLIVIEKRAEHYLHKAEAQYKMRRLLECIQSTDVAESVDVNYEYRYIYKDTSNSIQYSNLKSALYNYRGLAYYDLGNLKEAEKYFKKSLEYDPQFLLARFNLATVLQRSQLEGK